MSFVPAPIGSFIIGVSAIGGQPGVAFPQSGPTQLTKKLQSYLYEEYRDDDDLQAFVTAFNNLSQEYLDWFTNTPLALYTSDAISGPLLDWVGEGLYGMARPALPSGLSQDIGTYNTFLYNELAFNEYEVIGSQNFYLTTDDIYKRILTWHLYKGDGKVFTIKWLKRRIMRFLFGVNGTDPDIDNTYPVSISFGVGNQVNIGIGLGTRKVLGGSLYDDFDFNGADFNELDTSFTPYPTIPEAAIFKAAVASGALELPFQFTYTVQIT
jgi:hypothetical protein